MTRDRLGPPDYRQAASFGLDEETQTFVELEGGGKEAFTRMMRDGLYAAYTWRVRHFAEGTRQRDDDPVHARRPPVRIRRAARRERSGRRARQPRRARAIGEAAARANWQVDVASFALVEQGQERRPGGRVDHTFTYERPSPTLGEGRYRLRAGRLWRSADRASVLTSRFRRRSAGATRTCGRRTRRSAWDRPSAWSCSMCSAASASACSSCSAGAGCSGVSRSCGASRVAFMQALAAINEWPLLWMSYDTAVPRTTFFAQQCATIGVTFLGFSVFFALSFMAAETLTRAAFGDHPQFWRVWSRGPGSSTAILGRTAGGYLLVSLFFAYDVLLYLFTTRVFGWWTPGRGAAPPRRPGDLRAVALGHRQFIPGGLLGRVPVPGRAARGRRAHRRSLRQAPALPRHRLRRAGGRSSAPATRRIRISRRSRGRSSSSSLRSASACSTSISACCPASSCTSPSTSSGSRCRCSSLTRLASGSSNS